MSRCLGERERARREGYLSVSQVHRREDPIQFSLGLIFFFFFSGDKTRGCLLENNLGREWHSGLADLSLSRGVLVNKAVLFFLFFFCK